MTPMKLDHVLTSCMLLQEPWRDHSSGFMSVTLASVQVKANNGVNQCKCHTFELTRLRVIWCIPDGGTPDLSTDGVSVQAAHDAIKGAVHCTPVMTCHQMDALCPGDSRQLFFKVSSVCREREWMFAGSCSSR